MVAVQLSLRDTRIPKRVRGDVEEAMRRSTGAWSSASTCDQRPFALIEGQIHDARQPQRR
jgi:hypothetical protein